MSQAVRRSTPPAVLVWERSLLVYRQMWRTSMLGSLVQPLLYLTGMGLGVGSLVDESSTADSMLGGVSYLAFLAPALLAASAMTVMAQESLWPLLDGFMWNNAYRAMTATPITPRQVAWGVTLWHITRATIVVSGVAVVLLLFDDTRTWGLLLGVPFGVLTGLAFALPLTAWTSTRDTDSSFTMIMRFAIVPMFLFAGIFYPIDQLPPIVEAIAWVTPLWHGVELTRGAVLGTLELGETAFHVGVLVAYCVVGWAICARAFERRLFA